MSKKSFQKKKVRYIATLLSFLIVAFSFMPVFTVFASSQSIGTVDSDSITLNHLAAQISTVSNQYVPEGATELCLPVYLNFNSTQLWENYTYLSGYCLYGATPNSFGIYTGGSAQVTRAYFEPADDRNMYAIWLEGNSLRVYFDNARITSYSSSSGYVLIGYMIYKFDSAPTGFTYFTPTSSTGTITPSGYMRGSAYEYGLADSIIYAIDTSTDIEQIITWLSDISQNTALLSTVVTNLQNINGILGSIFNYLGTLNTNQQNAYRQLIWALSGVDFASTSSSALSTATYNRWVQLIYDAINYQGPDSSQADQAANDLEAAHDMNDQAQESAYAYMDSAIDDIDFQITVPQGLINSALTIGGYITQIWQNTGSDFQFLVTATLTIGLITVIIGAINRYPKTVTDSDTTQETYGVRNGKPYRHISRTKRHTTHHSK